VTNEDFARRTEKLGLNQAQVAKLFDVNIRTVFRWRSGRFKIPSLVASTLRSIEKGNISIRDVEKTSK
jgi:DNA-binding transcriptional regulator YiaG